MSLVQITYHNGMISRVKQGVTPVIELQLEDHQRVVKVNLRVAPWMNFRSAEDRVTADWLWDAYVETRL